MIDQDLIAYIAALGTVAGDRVHLGNAPQGAPEPFVVVRRTGGNTPKTLGGLSLFPRAQFSINTIANVYAEAYPVANSIHTALHGFRGTMGDTEVQIARALSEPADGSEIDGDKVIRWLTQDVLIVHR